MYLAKNNAYGLLASGIASGAVSLTLQSGQGDRFPAIAAPDYTFITLEDAAGNREIVKVTARAAASDVMTVVRAQEGDRCARVECWRCGRVAHGGIIGRNRHGDTRRRRPERMRRQRCLSPPPAT